MNAFISPSISCFSSSDIRRLYLLFRLLNTKLLLSSISLISLVNLINLLSLIMMSRLPLYVAQ